MGFPDIPGFDFGAGVDMAGRFLDPFGILGGANDKLNPDEKAKLSAVLARNGWGPATSNKNRMARAVVRRESNGNPKAKNKSGATGLFQMMTPLHCGNYGIPAGDNCQKWLEDPDNNAAAAHALFATSGWTPWKSSGPIPPAPTTWDPTVTTDEDSLLGGAAETAGDVAGAVASPFVAVGSAAVDLIGTLLSADTWFRIGKTALGGVFIVLGTGALVFIIANQASGGAAGKAAKTAAKAAVTKGAVK